MDGLCDPSFDQDKIEYSARILAADGDGNIYLMLGYIEVGPWESEMRWVDNQMDAMWFSNPNSRNAAVNQINPEAYSRYSIIPNSIEYLVRMTTVRVSVSPK